jgi:hypothetical protein
MGEEVKSFCKIKMDSINLTLTEDNRNHEVKKRHKISKRRFRFGEAMLVEFTFNIMRIMIVKNEVNLEKSLRMENGSVVAQSSMIVSFKYGCKSRFLPCSKEVQLNQAQVLYMPKKMNKINNSFL